MGFTGQGASVPEVAEAIRDALNRISAKSCGAGVLGYGATAATKFFDQGADFVAAGADTAARTTKLVPYRAAASRTRTSENQLKADRCRLSTH